MLNTYSKLSKSNNYIMAKCPNHPKAGISGYVYEHILVIENLRGSYLKPEETVHHIDENTLNNDPNNLMIFKNNCEHKWYHKKQRALKACGHELWEKCPFCQKYDDKTNMYTNGNYYRHKKCKSEYERIRRTRKLN